MSRRSRSRIAAGNRAHAPIFAALGDETRLLLLAKLCRGRPHSISQLSQGSKLSRQAITKHLHKMEVAGIIHGVRRGRETLFRLDPQPIDEIKEYLDQVSEQWDRALGRLKSFVEG
jgi:DNA-binding transcriptional ArsR family regulator